jgi:pimeloyl-ACP methyl ester carboxylesterase
MTRTDFRTQLGVVPLWHAAGARESRKPVMLTVTGAFAHPDTMTKLQAVVGPVCDCFLMHLPGNHAPMLKEATVAAFARALSEVIAREFAHRDVVLHGVSIGALTALAVRAAPVRRVVAVEPPLVASKLWPMLGPLQAKLRAASGDADMAAFVKGVFGVSANSVEERRYLDIFEGLDVPVDVVVGDRPLYPERREETYPSFVDEPERAWLKTLPGVTLHVGPNAGHNVPFQAPLFLKTILVDAMESLAAVLTPADRALLARAPLTGERVMLAGPRASALAAEYRRRNPTAEIATALSLASATGTFDLVVAGELSAEDAPRAAALLEKGGVVAALAPAARLQDLARPPLQVVRAHRAIAGEDLFDDYGTDLWPGVRDGGQAQEGELVVVARRGPTAPSLLVQMAAFAPRLMDIRTRLPAHGLRTDPELIVAYSRAPFGLVACPPEIPKVLVVQRPAITNMDGWRVSLATSIRDDWVVIMEFDDHPDLVLEVVGRKPEEIDWLRFGFTHAVQTSTPQLAQAFGQYNPEVKVFANAAFTLEPFPEGPAPRRVFYGAVSRGPFAAQVAASLGPVTAEFPEVEYLVIGDRAVFDALPTDRKVFHDFVPFDEYLRLMGTCAVSLSPIEGRRHQETKSDAKFLDASARGVLTLASPTIYAATIRHGETGLIAERVEDWAPLLAQALRDEPARRAMARNAWDYVRTERMFAQQVPERRRWYRDLWARRAELTEGVIRRVPGLAEELGRTRV